MVSMYLSFTFTRRMFCHTRSVILAFLIASRASSAYDVFSEEVVSTGATTYTSSTSTEVSTSVTAPTSSSTSSTSSTEVSSSATSTGVCVTSSDPDLEGFDTCCATCPTCGNERHLRGLTQFPLNCDDEPTIRDLICGEDAWNYDDGFDHYFCGNGEDVTLEETGLVDSVTDYWKNEKEQTIKNEICAAVTAGNTPRLWSTDWDVSRPWPTSCHFWIGGFTLYLSDFKQEFGTCNISIELNMQDSFDKPLDIYCGYPFPNNLWFSKIYKVTHTWTLDFTCPEPCKPPCGGKGEKCCGLDQCDGSLKCIDDMCMVFDCYPGDCKCEINPTQHPDAIIGCGYDAQWHHVKWCEAPDYICKKDGHTDCWCEGESFTQATVFP